MKNVKESSSEFIHIQVTVDTDALLKAHPVLSQDPKNPTWINDPGGFIYAVVSTNAIISGQGTSVINFNAVVGDKVRVYGTSEYGNLDNPVLIYNIQKLPGHQSDPDILINFHSQKMPKVAVQPSNSIDQVLPPIFEKMNFWYFEADVSKTGTENFTFHFALYKRDRKIANPQLVGYFQWDPVIKVDF